LCRDKKIADFFWNIGYSKGIIGRLQQESIRSYSQKNEEVQLFKNAMIAFRLLLDRCLKDGILERGFIFLGFCR